MLYILLGTLGADKENEMAHYRADVMTTLTRDEAFAYLSDFSTTAEWDPGVVEAQRLGDEPIGEGTEFHVVAQFLGRRTPLSYRVTDHDPPHAITLRGENATVVSVDRMTFEESGEGTRITYDARLTLKGPLALLDPVLAVVFSRIGDRALAGLRQTLAGRPPVPAAR
jgi:carbon monoxide dehydrogenase subunit G